MTNQELAALILEKVGGEENIIDYTNCVTRLRFNLKNNQLVDQQGLAETPGVLGTQFQSGQYQVILGGKVVNVEKAFSQLLTGKFATESHSNPSADSQEGPVSRMINTLSAILTPALPPVIAGGMLKGFIVMFTNFGWADPTSDSLIFLNAMSDAMFYFFPFLLAVSSAKRFKTNEFMALTIAGVMMYPLVLADGQSFIQLFGFLPIAVVNYSSSVLPIILSVWLLKYIEGFFNRVIPELVNMVFAPFFTLLITVPIAMVAIAPLGFYIGEYIAMGFSALIAISPWVAGLVFGATRPILVLGGMHHAMNPIAQQEIASNGESFLIAMILMSTFAQATAALVFYFRAQKANEKQVALSAVIPGYIGITEPALYGVLAKKKEALIASCIGGGAGAAVSTALGGKAMGFVMPGVLSLPAFLGEGFNGILIGLVISIVTTIIAYLVLDKYMKKDQPVTASDGVDEAKGVKTDNSIPANDSFAIFSPTCGQKIALDNISDETFSKSVLGKTIAIKSDSGKIFAPFSGKVEALFKTKHALGLMSEDGQLELLIHVGIDTVQLNGTYFNTHIEQGASFKKGDLLLSFDQKGIQDKGYDDVVIMAVTNSERFLEIIEYQETNEMVILDQTLLKAIK